MTKSIKRLVLVVASVLFLFCSAFGVIGVVNANAAEAIKLDSFAMSSGAYIRPDTPVGLRFEMGISKTDKSKLADKNATFGTLIVPKDSLSTELTVGTANVLNIETENWVTDLETSFDKNNYDVYFGTLVGPKNTDGAWTDFEQDLYDRAFVARGYVTYTENDQTKTLYTGAIERTIAGVAESAKAAGNDQSVLDEIINNTAKIEVTYDLNYEGADVATPQTVVVGHILNAQPTREGYIFDGWYANSACTQAASEIITENTTVYAKWQVTEEMKWQLEGIQTYSPSVMSLHYHGSTADLDNLAQNPIYYQAEEMTGADARKGTYKFFNDSNGNDAGIRMLYINGITDGKFAVGNYVVIEFYIVQGTAAHNNKYLDSRGAGDKYAIFRDGKEQTELTTGVWYTGVVEIKHLEGTTGNGLEETDYMLNIAPYNDTTCYISSISIYTEEAKLKAFGKTVEELWVEDGIANYSASVLSLTNTNLEANANTTYVSVDSPVYGKEGTYKHTTDGGSYDSRKMQVNTAMFGGKYVVGNYAVIEFLVENSASAIYDSWVYLVDSGAMTVYDSENNLVLDKEVQTGQWYKAVGKINTLNGGVYDDDNIAFSHETKSTMYIASVSIYTKEAKVRVFGKSAEELWEEDGIADFKPGVMSFASGDIQADYATWGEEAMTGEEAKDGTYKYTTNGVNGNNGGDGRKLEVNISSSYFALGNYFAIEFYIAEGTVSDGLYIKSASGDKYAIYDGTTEVTAVETGKWYTALVEIEDLSAGTYNDAHVIIADWYNTTCYISKVSVYTRAAKVNKFGASVADQFEVGAEQVATYGKYGYVGVLTSANPSEVSVVKEAMPGTTATENVRENTYKYTCLANATGTVLNLADIVKAGQYVVIEFYIQTKTTVHTNPEYFYYGNPNSVYSAVTIYDDNNNQVVAKDGTQSNLETGVWYKAAFKYVDDGSRTLWNYHAIGSELYVAKVWVYTAEQFNTEFGA